MHLILMIGYDLVNTQFPTRTPCSLNNNQIKQNMPDIASSTGQQLTEC
jgi:hypothetical protein